MAKKKAEAVSAGLSKKERLMAKLLEEKKLSEKEEESLKIGALSDFNEIGRENYKITGILGYDLNVGGIKRGTFNVLYGAESSGKTTTALNLIEGIQMTDEDALTLYVDSETTVDDKFLSRMPYLIKDNIIFLKEGVAEYAFNKILEYAKENLVDYIVIDSIDTLIPLKELEKGLEDSVMMEKARIISRALPQLQSFCRENNLTVIFIQQLRTQFSGQFAIEGRSGGKAMRFYPATVVKLSNINSQNEIDNNGNIISKFVKIKNEKSKIGNPYTETFSFINTSSEKVSIDRIKECLFYAFDLEIINKKGAWVYIPDENGELKSINGSIRALEEFKKNINLYSLTKMRVYGKKLDPEIFIIKYDEIVELLKTENRKIKNNKISLLTALNRLDLITKEDKEEIDIFDGSSPEDYMDETIFKRAKFEMLTIEEKQKFLSQKAVEQKTIENTEGKIIEIIK